MQVAFEHGFDETQQNVRDANHLQAQLVADSRYESVRITYEDPPNLRGEWLWVQGSVPDQTALDSLHQMIDDDTKWYVQWDVRVVERH